MIFSFLKGGGGLALMFQAYGLAIGTGITGGQVKMLHCFLHLFAGGESIL